MSTRHPTSVVSSSVEISSALRVPLAPSTYSVNQIARDGGSCAPPPVPCELPPVPCPPVHVPPVSGSGAAPPLDEAPPLPSLPPLISVAPPVGAAPPVFAAAPPVVGLPPVAARPPVAAPARPPLPPVDEGGGSTIASPPSPASPAGAAGVPPRGMEVTGARPPVDFVPALPPFARIPLGTATVPPASEPGRGRVRSSSGGSPQPTMTRVATPKPTSEIQTRLRMLELSVTR